jgi:hypothetical protein
VLAKPDVFMAFRRPTLMQEVSQERPHGVMLLRDYPRRAALRAGVSGRFPAMSANTLSAASR